MKEKRKAFPHQKIEDKRYEATRKRLDLKKERSKKKKFIIIQIDSLPHSILKRFLDKGSCKFMNKLIDKEGYHLQKYNCGIPSGTPSVQAGIMYGDNSRIPGFRFVDKKNKKQISFGNPNHVKYIESKYFAHKKGILEGGSSYANNYSGGASRSILTMSTMTKNKKFKRIKESTLWLFLFLHPASAIRIIYYTITELVMEFLSVLFYPFIKLFKKHTIIFGFRIPLRRFLLNVILAELITMGVILDIKRGVPKIYINYMNYDDIAHLRGPNSLGAHFMVRALDRRVNRIYKKTRGEYDFYVMSDHGQVDAVPFRILQGMNLAEFIEKCAKVKSFGLSSTHEGRHTMMGAVMNKTIDLVKYVSTPLRWIVSSFAKGMLKVLKKGDEHFIWNNKEQIFVVDSCSFAHIYFNVSKKRMQIKQIEKKYPTLIEKLARNKHIGIVMAKQGTNIILMSGKNRITITKDTVKVDGQDFLKKYGNEKLLVKQLRDFDTMKFVGDLVLFGNYENGVAVSFTEHVGAHGGIGGDMMWPFFLSKKKYDFSKMTNAKSLNKIFKEY